MEIIPKISEAEWTIMKVIWEKPNVTSSEIIDKLREKNEWKSTTIKSLISRLLKKKVISFEKKGKEYFYYPLVEEKVCIKEESNNFINRFFNGSLKSMLLNFVKTEKLSNDEIEELKEILDKSSNNKED